MDPIGTKSYSPEVFGTDTTLINTFPSDLIWKIFSYLSFTMLRAGCLTCKKWELLLKLENNPRLWKQLVFQQDGCCFKLWDHKKISAIDPALRLKEMGFVGLSAQGEEVIRTIMAERCSPLKEEIKKRSIQILNGVLVCGPSGTGKTLLVRSLSSLLNCKRENIQLLSGHTTYNKWKEKSTVDVGEIFTETFKAAQASKNKNETFLLVIDDIDAIFSRFSNESNHSWIHSVVDEFLAKMKELRSVYNILVIGTTNHLGKINEAVTKLGIFDEHIKLAIPDLQGRKEHLHIGTLSLVKQNLLASDIDFNVLAQESEGLTGADIQAFIKHAMSFTMQRMIVSKSRDLEGAFAQLTMNDLWLALNEVKTRRNATISSDM